MPLLARRRRRVGNFEQKDRENRETKTKGRKKVTNEWTC